jgi:hypothetical protein
MEQPSVNYMIPRHVYKMDHLTMIAVLGLVPHANLGIL